MTYLTVHGVQLPADAVQLGEHLVALPLAAGALLNVPDAVEATVSADVAKGGLVDDLVPPVALRSASNTARHNTTRHHLRRQISQP